MGPIVFSKKASFVLVEGLVALGLVTAFALLEWTSWQHYQRSQQRFDQALRRCQRQERQALSALQQVVQEKQVAEERP